MKSTQGFGRRLAIRALIVAEMRLQNLVELCRVRRNSALRYFLLNLSVGIYTAACVDGRPRYKIRSLEAPPTTRVSFQFIASGYERRAQN